MKELFFALQSFILEIINNEIYVNILSMIVVSFTSYQIAKYNASKPQRIKIKQLQLQNVYLPLFRILSNFPEQLSKKQTLVLYKKITNILDSHYELAFPQLHRLVSRLRVEIVSDKDPAETLKIIKHQVSIDYELLKKSLGYPSESLLRVFTRMTLRQKVRTFQIWISLLLLMTPAILICVSLWYFQKRIALVFILLLLFLLFLLCFPFLGFITRHMDD